MEEEKKDEQKKFLSLQPRGNGLPIKGVCGERGRREGGGKRKGKGVGMEKRREEGAYVRSRFPGGGGGRVLEDLSRSLGNDLLAHCVVGMRVE